MTATSPKTHSRPEVELFFSGIDKNMGHLFRRFEFKGMVNNGYTIRCQLFDADYQLLRQLTDGNYFSKPRSQPLELKFRIKSGPHADGPAVATETRTAVITHARMRGDLANRAIVEFIGVDKPSWRLNIGDGSGAVYKGCISDVIKQVIQKYAPDITFDVGKTIDNAQNKWYMMRQNPQSFIASLLQWSASLTTQKTHWLVVVGDNELIIKEQAAFTSQQRAFYRRDTTQSPTTIKNWEVVANNALSLAQTKIITQGIASSSGQYFDKATDKDENIVFAKDSTTSNKQTPDVQPTTDNGTSSARTFTKPDDGVGFDSQAGWTAVPAIPEIYSGGELGLEYSDYIDGTARTTYLDLLQNLLSVKFRVFGHGEWSDCKGLGVDTIYIKWVDADKVYWLTGNWLVYGFHHIVDKKGWWTDIIAARQDSDSDSKRVGNKS